MTKGLYETQINRAWEILKTLQLDGTRFLYPIYPLGIAADFRRLSYLDTWKKCYANNYYHFQLSDQSLIQFRVQSFAPLNVSYAYYECPYYPVMSFDEFLIDLGELVNYEEEMSLREEYESYISQNIKDICTPFRYDYCVTDYKEGRHPASHMHFGHKNHIRIGTKKVLRPLSFVWFLLRHAYPDAWQKLTAMPEAEEWMREISANLIDVEDRYWNKMDEWEMILR